MPELLPPEKRGGTIDDLDVVGDAVGLRPTREGGIRLEVDYTGAHSMPDRLSFARLTRVCCTQRSPAFQSFTTMAVCPPCLLPSSQR